MSATQMQDTPPSPTEIDPDLELVLPGKSRPAGAGMDWIKEGWSLFTRAPLMWIVSLILIFVVAVVVSLIPFIGTLIFQVLQPVIAGGYMVGCRSLEKNGEFEIEHLTAGFSKRFGPLAIVGLIYLVGWIVVMVITFVIAGMSLIPVFMEGDTNAALAKLMASAGLVMLAVLVMLALMVPLLAAYWFAPALVMMHDMKPLDAMKASFSACFRNFVPFLVWGIVMTIGAIVAVIPFGLGLIVWLPVAIASTYVAYRDIFTEG
jgi:uncharacterized membrane protein